MTLMRFLPRFRRAYRALRELEAREGWSRPQIEALQLQRLNDLWGHAVRHVPYYRALRTRARLPERFASLAEFRASVPVLPKDAVRSRRQEFLSECAARGSWERSGGSTGSPMSVYWAKAAHRETLWAKYRMDATWDLDIFDRKVFLWGHGGSFAPGLAGLLARVRQPWQDRLRNRLRLSAYRLGPDDLTAYLKRLSAFAPASLYGYSTALYLLAQHAAAADFGCPSLKLATLSGEPAFPHLLDGVRAGFGVPAVIEYGAVECGFIAGQWPDGTLRVREDLTLAETLPREDGLFDIVLTVLSNPSFPLIRYAIEDVTTEALLTPPVGFSILKNVWGRRNDMVVSRSGRLVHSLGIKHVFEHCPGVRRFSAHQDGSGELFVSVEAIGPARLDTSEAQGQLQQLLEGYPVTIEQVAVIPGTLAGKHRWVVSDLAERRYGLRNGPFPEPLTR
jgi:phenylacetate-CoA ligase